MWYHLSFDENDLNAYNQVMIGVARAVTVTNYADFMDERESMYPTERIIVERALSIGLVRTAGVGESWEDVIQGVSQPAKNWAYALAALVSGGDTLGSLLRVAVRAEFEYGITDVEGVYQFTQSNPAYCQDFGWYTAMEAMGTGVEWADSHVDTGAKIPHLSAPEFHLSDLADIIDVPEAVFYAVLGAELRAGQVFDTEYWERNRRYYTENPAQAKKAMEAVQAAIDNEVAAVLA